MFQKWCDATSCNGVADWYQSKSQKYHFAFWTLTMIVMVTVCIFFTIKTCLGFIETPIITSYMTLLFYNKTMPEVAICFNGGLNASALMQANFSDELILRLSDTKTTNHNESVSKELESYLSKNDLKMPEFITKFGYTCEDMLSRKFQAGDLSLTNVGCQDVTYFPSGAYGLCMVFKNNGHQYWPDLDGGIRFHLTVPPMSVSEFKPDLVNETDRSIAFLMTVVERFDFSMVKSRFILPNMKTEIILTPIHYVRLLNGGNCGSDAIYLSTNDCFQRCYSRIVFESCGCIPLKYYNPLNDFNKPTCTLNEVQCSNYSDSKTVQCENFCKPLCDEWVYDMALSISPLTGIKKPKSVVWIGFVQMQYTKIEEVYAFTYDMVIANVGGQAGLWLGCSFITIIQLLYYMWIAFWEKTTSRNLPNFIKTINVKS